MNRAYSAAELDEILALLARHRDDDRGMRLLGLCMAAFSGFLAALVLCALAWAQGWLS